MIHNTAEMSADQLVDEALKLSELKQQPYLTEQRRQQIDLQLGRIVFEYRYRHGDFDTPDAA